MDKHFKANKDAASEAGKKSSRKGTPNKTTKELRDSFQLFVENNVSQFQKWIEQVAESNPAKAIELVTSLGEYILPKLSRTEIEADVKQEVTNLNIDNLSLEELEQLEKINDKLNRQTD
jgi:hypothetical protein